MHNAKPNIGKIVLRPRVSPEINVTRVYRLSSNRKAMHNSQTPKPHNIKYKSAEMTHSWEMRGVVVLVCLCHFIFVLFFLLLYSVARLHNFSYEFIALLEIISHLINVAFTNDRTMVRARICGYSGCVRAGLCFIDMRAT